MTIFLNFYATNGGIKIRRGSKGKGKILQEKNMNAKWSIDFRFKETW